MVYVGVVALQDHIMVLYGCHRMVRKVLSSVLQLQTLDDDGLKIVLCEVEAILNDRPITLLMTHGSVDK